MPCQPEAIAATKDRSRLFDKLARCLDEAESTIYPEPQNALSRPIVEKSIAEFIKPLGLLPSARIADIGCGYGVALEAFRDHGFTAEGVTLGPDAAHCRALGFTVHENDMSDLDFGDASLDLVYARHVLEHSIMPLFTLKEWRRVLKPGGHLYVEVPCPETSAGHEDNPNHYAVFGLKMWSALFGKAGFRLLNAQAIEFQVPCGPDRYWMFWLKRPGSLVG